MSQQTRQPPARRHFIIQLAACGAALHAGRARAQARVDEDSETAVSLGYKHDTAQVDAKKYPQHKPEQKCLNCSFWQGAQTDAWAGCSMFGRKQIAAGGWCVAWRKA